MSQSFIDTNIFIYHLLQEDPAHSIPSSAFLVRLSAGEARAWCSSTVVLETVFLLERRRNIPRDRIYPALRDIVTIDAITWDFRQAILDALDFWVEQPPLSIADCYHLALTEHLELTQVMTFDKKMDRYPGIERIEP